MATLANQRTPTSLPTRPAVLPQQRQPLERAPRIAPFSVIVLADPHSAFAGRIDATLRSAGALDVRYATSPADLLRAVPHTPDRGIGVLCRSPRSQAVLQLIGALRHNGWRRIVIACHESSEASIRLAIASKVRCVIIDPSQRNEDDPALAEPGAPALSAREVQVLQGVADGNTNNEIGELLGLSGLTIKSHLARIGRKTGTGDRAAMVAAAMRAGIVH